MIVYEISIFELIELNNKWKYFWDEFLNSCTFPTQQRQQELILNRQEFERNQKNSPRKFVDTILEFYLKYKKYNQRMFSEGSNVIVNDWSVSNGKFCRHLGSNPAVVRCIHHLENLLGDDLLPQRGNFYYPNGGYREWHTNQFDPHGWRMYVVRTSPSGCATFRYKNPRSSSNSEEIYDCPDYDGTVRLFRISSREDALWHTIISEGDRWSLGVLLSDESAEKIIQMYHTIINKKNNNNNNNNHKNDNDDNHE